MIEITNGKQSSIKLDDLNIFELNSILYYADFLSLEKCSKPVTDNCKYFFIHGVPINCSYLVECEPEYDKENKFIVMAYNQYFEIRDKFGQDGVESFIGDLGMLRARGCIGALEILCQIHIYSTKKERKSAFKEYFRWLAEQKYEHTIYDENGQQQKVRCTRYFAHHKKRSKKRTIFKSFKQNHRNREKNVKE